MCIWMLCESLHILEPPIDALLRTNDPHQDGVHVLTITVDLTLAYTILGKSRL